MPKMPKTVSVNALFLMAMGLRSEHGENPEYDRALVELCTEASGRSMDGKHTVAKLLGIPAKGKRNG